MTKKSMSSTVAYWWDDQIQTVCHGSLPSIPEMKYINQVIIGQTHIWNSFNHGVSYDINDSVTDRKDWLQTDTQQTVATAN